MFKKGKNTGKAGRREKWKDYLPNYLYWFIDFWVVFILNTVLFYLSMIFFLQGVYIVRKTVTKLF